MKTRILLLAWLALSGLTQVNAATNFVILGDDFQTKINAAAPGDTLVVQGGVYTGNLNFSTPLTVLCSGTNGIQLTGSAMISAAGKVSFSQVIFLGAVQIQTNVTAVFSRSAFSNSITSSGGIVQAFDSRLSNLNATGGSALIKRSIITSGINLNNTAFEAMRLTNNTAVLIATASGNQTNRFIAVQSYFQAMSLSGYQAWLGYNDFTSAMNLNPLPPYWFTAVYLTNCDSILVGNQVHEANIGSGNEHAGVYAFNGKLRAYSNRVRADANNNGECFGFMLDGASGEVVNNSVYAAMSGGPSINALGVNVVGVSGVPAVIVRANAIYSSRSFGIQDQSQSVASLSYCCVYSGAPAIVGVTPFACLLTDPMFGNMATKGGLSATSDWLALQPGSPCINAGPPDAIYNNTDGTRNTIGHTGGPYWNPANYTNNNPIVFWLSTSNQVVLKGSQTTIPLNVGASSGH